MSLDSKAVQYFTEKGWMDTAKFADDHVILEVCPVCLKPNYHFYCNITPEKDGLCDCKVCTFSGNLTKLRQELGDINYNQDQDKSHALASTQDWAQKDRKPDPLPNVAACYNRLINDLDGLDYVLNARGWSRAIVDALQLGMMQQNGKRYLVIPYFNAAGEIVFAKYRTMPPAEKMFFISKGHPIRLFNENVIQPEMEELILVEGEPDTISMLDKGIENVVGIPGANAKKTEWISKLDNAKPKQIYILFDNDKPGQQAAEALAKKITLNSALPTPLSIVLPPFQTNDGEEGKDISEWFRSGHTKEEFEELKKKALPFEVKGVMSLGDALDRLEAQLEGKETLEPRYVTKYAPLNIHLGGFEYGDVIDIIAEGKMGKTTFALNLIDDLVERYKEPGLVECLEMTGMRLARKWVSMVTRTDDSPGKTDEEKRQKLVAMKAAIPKAKEIALGREADLLFGYAQVKDPNEVYDTIRLAKRLYNVRFVVLDNVQLLADQTLKNLSHRTIHISQISKKLKALALELELVLFRIIQPRSVREGEMANHNSADGSSQISKDCDTSISLHRNARIKLSASDLQTMQFIEEEQSFEPQLYTRVSISRYAPGGMCTLKFEGEYSRVTEWEKDEMGVFNKPIMGLDAPKIETPTVTQY